MGRRLLKLLTLWHDEEKTDMKSEETNRAVNEAKENVDKTRKIVAQYKLAGVIIAQERKGAPRQ